MNQTNPTSGDRVDFPKEQLIEHKKLESRRCACAVVSLVGAYFCLVGLWFLTQNAHNLSGLVTYLSGYGVAGLGFAGIVAYNRLLSKIHGKWAKQVKTQLDQNPKNAEQILDQTLQNLNRMDAMSFLFTLRNKYELNHSLYNTINQKREALKTPLEKQIEKIEGHFRECVMALSRKVQTNLGLRMKVL